MAKVAENRIWTMGFALAFVTKLFSTCVFIIYTSTLINYMYNHYQASDVVAGLAVGVFILFSVVGRILSAQLDERFVRKSILVVSALAFLLLSAAYLLPINCGLFIGVRALHGVAFGLVNNEITIIATDMLPPERLGEGLGIYALSASIATTIAPLSGVLLMQFLGYQSVIVTAVVFAAIAFLSSLGQRASHINCMEENAVESEHVNKLSINDFLEKQATPISLIIAVLCLCYAGSVTPYIVSYSQIIGLGAFSFLYFLVYTITLLIARPAMGMLQDRKGSNSVMYPALICVVIGLLILIFVPSLFGVILTGILLGIGHGTAFSAGQTIAVRMSKPERVGFATSTYFALADLGTGIGPAVMGVMFGLFGYVGMYTCAATISVLLIPLYAVMYWHKRRMAQYRFCGH